MARCRTRRSRNLSGRGDCHLGAIRSKSSLSGEELSDLLIERGDLVDTLVETWHSFEAGEFSSVDFEVRLEMVVIGLEEFISRASL
jgi:hypothetical protein